MEREGWRVSWGNEKPTEKQLELLAEMNEFSEFSLPPFTGKTKGEASDWIDQNMKQAHESSWDIEHGY